MATSARGEVPAVTHGVVPLQAGKGRQFLLRRLHSFSGIFPIGAFLIEHFISNAYATNGPDAYNQQVRFLTSLPFVPGIEFLFIYLPLLYHSIYGFYVWYRGEGNAGVSYPWMGNWMYAAQRWTGAIAFFYMAYHVYTMRFSGIHLLTNSGASFAKVYDHFSNPAVVAFYILGITAASWHFAYGLWIFAAKWGFIPGENARRKFGYVCLALGIGLVAIGVATMIAFLNTSPEDVPRTTETALLFLR